MKDYKFMKFLKEKMIVDSYQYYEACSYKIYLSELSFSALKNVICDYQKNETTIVEKVFEDAAMTGKGIYKSHSDTVNYLGIEVSQTVIMDKLTMEIMSLLHNFFDTFAQWLNSSLFAEDGLPIDKVSLVKVSGKMSQFSEYAGSFISEVIGLPSNEDYLYIADYNNTLKHRRQIHVENKFDILAIKGSVAVPEFEKDGRPHVKENAINVLHEKIRFCKELLSDSRTYIETYFSQRDNQHVSHRFYNPKTFLYFKNRVDYENMRSPLNHYYYIEVDETDLLDSYQFMLVCDQMDDSPNERIEVYNSPYHIIMLIGKDTGDVIGVLKPEDDIDVGLKEERELFYRKYVPQTIGYEQEMYMATSQNEPFHYYPYLSDMTADYDVLEE